MSKKASVSTLKRKIQERVNRTSEPFKGTLLRTKLVPTHSVDTESNQASDKGRESVEKKQSSLEKKLREKIEGRDKPFYGSLGNPAK